MLDQGRLVELAVRRSRLAWAAFRVIAIRIPIADSPVRTMNEELALLVDGDLSPSLDRISLSGMDTGDSVTALSTDCPLVCIRDYMLVGHTRHPP